MNNNGGRGGGGANGNDLSGLGDWAYRDQPSAYETHQPSTVRNNTLYHLTSARAQQSYPTSGLSTTAQASVTQSIEPRRRVPSVNDSPPAQSNAPYYSIPSTPPSVGFTRSYATVASSSPRSSTASSYTVLQQQRQRQQQQRQQSSNYQRAMMAKQSQLAVEIPRTSSNIIQRRPQQGPSYAQVVARSQAHPHQAHHRTANDASLDHIQPSQQYQPGIGQWPCEDPNPGAPQAPAAFGNWTGGISMDDSWTFDPNLDFSLYDDSLNRYFEQPAPYVAPGSLVINSSAPAPPSRLLMSPADSIDASSMTSSTRRSKKEIMEGGSGEFKCRHCGGGFNTSDDRRHHEDRVHLPYQERQHECRECEQRFVYSKDLKRHLLKHGDREANAQFFCKFANCKYAEKGFFRNDHLQRHLATHCRADSAIQMSRSTSAQTFS